MAFFGQAMIVCLAVALVALGASRALADRRALLRRPRSGRSRAGRPVAIRPLAGRADGRRALRARDRPAPARTRRPGRGDRGEALRGRARAAGSDLRLAAGGTAGGARLRGRHARCRRPRLRSLHRAGAGRRLGQPVEPGVAPAPDREPRRGLPARRTPRPRDRGHAESSHGSQNLAGGAPDVLAATQSVLQAAALVATWILFARGPASPSRLLLASAAALVAFVSLGKVLSPQFLIWLIPVIPLVRAPRACGRHAPDGGSRPHAALVPVPLLGPRAPLRSARVLARPRPGPRARRPVRDSRPGAIRPRRGTSRSS